MKKRFAFLLCAFAPCVLAQSTPAVDPALLAAETAGAWEVAGARGEYRILVFSAGYEHVSSWVLAEWIAAPTGNSSTAAVVHSKQLVGPGLFTFEVPRMTPQEGYVRVELQGFDTHQPERKETCTFDLLPNGEYKATRPCG